MEKPVTHTKLIVYLAFVRDEEGELQPAFEAREAQNEAAAKQQARILWSSGKYAGALAWWRSADLANGDFGDPVILFQEGEVPDMA
ncbi:MAG: hypothetical protein P0Y65_07555 [Candidatus Devosia phytovorans]|uniref:Uncharacterized protein n=1 Tax=Candidatus Devosia phytovorans TaxID=3121372 RepID=A0AAJ5VXQ7_9HYPH|nr:hypothetical protein [Devosia sp.]WEK06100.1 MAG: hypothetical protein P0Y65_07555 [Devosia sp.]